MTDVLASAVRLPCGATLPNRLAKAAMSEGLADTQNRATGRHSTLYRRWARGGAGLLVTGNVHVDCRHLERPGNIAIDNNGGLAELKDMASAGTCMGNHCWMQINHAGRQTPISVNSAPLAPSAVKLPGAGFGVPLAMTESQIVDVIDRFTHVAVVARDSKFSGVQIHAAHGYLMSQFLNPAVNIRTDAWGGSLENRARLLIEVTRSVRKAVGRDFPVTVKLNSADFQVNGFSVEDSLQVLRWLGEDGIDLVEVSGGNYEYAQMMLGNLDAAGHTSTTPVQVSTRAREAYFLEFAERARPASRMPLMVTGGFRSAAAMRSAVSTKSADIIGLGRPLCADPDACVNVLSGAVNRVPSVEQLKLLDRAQVSPAMSEPDYRAMVMQGMAAWCFLQLIRLGDGLAPDFSTTPLQAIDAYAANEQQTASTLQRSWQTNSAALRKRSSQIGGHGEYRLQ